MHQKPIPTYLNFDKEHYPWKSGINYKDHPTLYRVGKGEQGVLICEPYKSEIGIHWRFKTKEIAEQSSKDIFDLFIAYLQKEDFVGADMARKYLQMGYTRARRYTNYKGGKKYDKGNSYVALERGTGEMEKAEAAAVFYRLWKMAEANPAYSVMKKDWKNRLG